MICIGFMLDKGYIGEAVDSQYRKDFIIWNRLTDNPVKEFRLIGDILGQVTIGVGDWWYAARIEHFIRQGRIKIVEDSENKYARLIKGYL